VNQIDLANHARTTGGKDPVTGRLYQDCKLNSHHQMIIFLNEKKSSLNEGMAHESLNFIVIPERKNINLRAFT